MTDISIGLIGAGMMGQEHIQNFNLLDGVRVGAIADTNASMRDTAAALCAQKITPMADFEKLLTDPSLDAFVIATPNFHHIDVLRPALETGKPILCEKPLCTTLEDTREILTRLEADKQIFQVGMEYRFKPALADMIARVDAGETGRLHMLSIREHRFPFLQKVDDWNRFNRNTGGTLVEKCCHFFDLMRRIIGSEPVRVMASAGRDVNHLDESYHGDVPDILDNAYVIFDFENGARALLDLCMFAEASRHHEELCAIGETGKVECLLPQNIVARGARADWQMQSETVHVAKEILDAGYHSGATYFQNQAFLRAVRGEADVIVTADDGHRAVAMGVAAQMAAAQGRTVAMQEVGL
jgi:predicted dehydrogenase